MERCALCNDELIYDNDIVIFTKGRIICRGCNVWMNRNK